MSISKPTPVGGTQQLDKSAGVSGGEVTAEANSDIAAAKAKAKAFNEQQQAENAAAGNVTLWPKS